MFSGHPRAHKPLANAFNPLANGRKPLANRRLELLDFAVRGRREAEASLKRDLSSAVGALLPLHRSVQFPGNEMPWKFVKVNP